MKSINELRREIQTKKLMHKLKEESIERDIERKKLEKQLREMESEEKYGKYKEAGRKVLSGAKTAFSQLNRGINKMQRNYGMDRSRGLGLFK